MKDLEVVANLKDAVDLGETTPPAKDETYEYMKGGFTPILNK